MRVSTCLATRVFPLQVTRMPGYFGPAALSGAGFRVDGEGDCGMAVNGLETPYLSRNDPFRKARRLLRTIFAARSAEG
jgi:hypothetical protein